MNNHPRRKYTWSTKPARSGKIILDEGLRLGRAGNPTAEQSTKRCRHHINRLCQQREKARARFLRFNTTPDWRAIQQAHEGAALAMIESSRRRG